MAGLLAGLLSGCFGGGKKEPPPEGGIHKYSEDKDAPKEIASTELVKLEAWYYDPEGIGDFALEKGEDGAVTLRMGSQDPVEVPQETLAGAEEIIRRLDLAQWNGVYDSTTGLPAEHQSSVFSAEYASGEKLSFTKPGGAWGLELNDYFTGVLEQARKEET